ncbi:MAG: hypothetical protein EOP90_04525 [Lysobacteraceae bacterium]|nr:MAG: hypothetical protein EOP90_04525 [Xanthomonadaceae bacterium]
MCALLAALAMLVLAGPGQAEAPVVGPQWTAPFWRDVPAQDGIAPSEAPTWQHLPDGSTALFTTPGGLWFRRFAPDGIVAAFARLTPQQAGIPASDLGHVRIGTDPIDGGFHLLVNAGAQSSGCWLVHVDAGFRMRWTVAAPGNSTSPQGCLGFHVLQDGSMFVLQSSTLARLGRDGQTLWVRGQPESSDVRANAFAVDANDVAWVVGRGGNEAAVTRYSAAGELLSSDTLLCGTCVASVADAIDVLPNGDVLVGGRSGSFQPGLLVRYDSSGARRLWVDTEIDVGYSRITHDDDGAVYVGVHTPYGSHEIRRVDPVSGMVQWNVEADGFGAAAHGIITLERRATGLFANAIDAAGATTWSTLLSPYPTATFSRPFAGEGGGVELLVREPEASSTPACGNSPRLLRLDASGVITGELQACTQPVAKDLWDIDALPGVGALASIGSELVAFDPVGDERWRVVACASCLETSAHHWQVSALTADGGAWAVRSLHGKDGITTTLERITPDGHIAFTVPAVGGVWGAWGHSAMRLFIEHDRVIALTAGTRRLVWQSVGLDGSPLGTHDISMPDDNFDIRSARLNADGSVTVVALGEIFCGVGCNPFHLSFRRIAPDGALSWGHDFYYVDWPAMPMPDGGAMMVLPDSDSGADLVMQRFDWQGWALAPVPLAGVTPNSRPVSVSGPIDGRWLLHTLAYDDSEQALWSIGEDGEVGAARMESWNAPHAFGSSGYLVPTATPAGVRMQLLDPLTLQERAILPFGSSGDEDFDYGPWHWRMLEDGSVYGTWLSPDNRTGLARYALPWGAPQDRMFRNGFE